MSRCWLGVADDDPFGIDNLPYGRAVLPDESTRLVVRIGTHVLDVTAIGHPASLDELLRSGRAEWDRTRAEITRALSDESQMADVEPHLYALDEVALLLPFTVADYVDFYASEHHATAVGRLFRPGGDPLTPNWKHLPIGYHGRAGTVVVSGTEIQRPSGQYGSGDSVVTAPTQRLDIEAEVAFVVGTPSVLGQPVPITDFADHVLGVCLLNDWSARDIQRFEAQPLGPFLGKSFATSISAWITPLAALAEAWCPTPTQNPIPAQYLRSANSGLTIDIEVTINGRVVSRPPYASQYWSPSQMLAHMTVNGATLRTGDLFASGTVSGPNPDQAGSLLELTSDGATGHYLQDGDEVVLRASAPGPAGPIGLGDVRGVIAGN